MLATDLEITTGEQLLQAAWDYSELIRPKFRSQVADAVADDARQYELTADNFENLELEKQAAIGRRALNAHFAQLEIRRDVKKAAQIEIALVPLWDRLITIEAVQPNSQAIGLRKYRSSLTSLTASSSSFRTVEYLQEARGVINRNTLAAGRPFILSFNLPRRRLWQPSGYYAVNILGEDYKPQVKLTLED